MNISKKHGVNMKKEIITLMVLLIPFMAFGSGIKEDKVYEINESKWITTPNLTLPEFLTEKEFTYFKDNAGENIWHTFEIKNNNPENSAFLVQQINIKTPLLLNVADTISSFGLPSKVIIVENRGDFFHLTLAYSEIKLYFGVNWNRLSEIRFESPTSFKLNGSISYGSPLSDVINILPPENIIEDKTIDWNKKNVLYKNIDDINGYHYIDYEAEKVRIFFYADKVAALYLY